MKYPAGSVSHGAASLRGRKRVENAIDANIAAALAEAVETMAATHSHRVGRPTRRAAFSRRCAASAAAPAMKML
jgi:hypothetical protein